MAGMVCGMLVYDRIWVISPKARRGREVQGEHGKTLLLVDGRTVGRGSPLTTQLSHLPTHSDQDLVRFANTAGKFYRFLLFGDFIKQQPQPKP